jgi:hypothetical protein
MKLIDLNPQFVFHGGEDTYDANHQPIPKRESVGLAFDCPCEKCMTQRASDLYMGHRHYVAFKNPPDGGPPVDPTRPQWQRTGTTFETLVLSPSIYSMVEKGGCGWHGYVGGPAGDKPGIVTDTSGTPEPDRRSGPDHSGGNVMGTV